jgi:protein-S-isoprenylcysteine O-methyltransferase Ste14
MLGSAVFLQSAAGFLIFGIAMLYVYHLRIKTEEKTLLQNFKEEYAQYCQHTWKMFPMIW